MRLLARNSLVGKRRRAAAEAMTKTAVTSDLSPDPFDELTSTGTRKRLQLLGGKFEFASSAVDVLETLLGSQ